MIDIEALLIRSLCYLCLRVSYLLNERRAVDTDTAYVLVLYHTVAIMRYLCEQLTFPSQSSRVAPTDTVLSIVVVEHYDSLAYF